jgi:hypothetical protein
VYFMCMQELRLTRGITMNLRAAQKELRGRSPHVALPWLALEALVVVSLSMLLVGYFA